jgi:hypothetical protein
VNHVECDVRDNLGNPSVAVARFARAVRKSGLVTSLRLFSSGGRLLQRLGGPQVQKLAARDRDGCQQGLAHQVMGKREARLLATGSGHKQAHALGVLEGDQKVIERCMVLQHLEKFKAKTGGNRDCSRQY